MRRRLGRIHNRQAAYATYPYQDLTDVFAIQNEIAIANALKLKLSVEGTSRRRYEPKQGAYEAYLKARHLWGKIAPDSLARCEEYLKQAIELDPEFALAHCGYADHLLLLASAGYMPAHHAMPLIREEALKALHVDPSLPEAHALLGIVAAVYDYNWEEAKRLFLLAISNDPVPPRVRQWYGNFYLGRLGRLRESLVQQERGLRDDPLNFTARVAYAFTLIIDDRLPDAQAEAEKILELEENNVWAFLALAYASARQEKWEQARIFAEKASPAIPWAIGTLAGVLKRMGKISQAEELIQKLLPGSAYGVPIGICSFHALCGETDQAVHWMEKVIEQRDPTAGNYALQFFRSSPHWPALAKPMNLPEQAE